MCRYSQVVKDHENEAAGKAGGAAHAQPASSCETRCAWFFSRAPGFITLAPETRYRGFSNVCVFKDASCHALRRGGGGEGCLAGVGEPRRGGGPGAR
jgi:hypothetical protein